MLMLDAMFVGLDYTDANHGRHSVCLGQLIEQSWLGGLGIAHRFCREVRTDAAGTRIHLKPLYSTLVCLINIVNHQANRKHR